MSLSDLSFADAASVVLPTPSALAFPAAGGLPGRLLVIGENDRSVGHSLTQTLCAAGLCVGSCEPSHAESVLVDEPHDLVVIDADAIPVRPAELTARLRCSEAWGDRLIVVVGTPGPDDMCRLSFEAGADEWIARPFDARAVVRRLVNLLELSRLRRQQWGEQSRTQQELSHRSTRLDTLIETGLMLSMERDRSKLLRRLLDEGRRLLHCDGATMFIVTEEKTLRFELRTRKDDLPAFQIPLYDRASGLPNENYVSVYTAIHNRSVLIDDVYRETRFDLSGTRAFDAGSRYRTVSMLTVPISPRGGEPVGVLQFMNAMDRGTGRIVPFAPEMVNLVEALAAQAAVALDNLSLVEAQKQLVDSLIRVLATAVDAKSPYTGRHCQRVPDIAMALAEAACRADEGPLADFAFRSDEEWQEFRIGAWLHDCGKVASPEYVIDKATKLETIHNRIHDVRMRFEVLLRDIEIQRLSAQNAGSWNQGMATELLDRDRQLHEDFAFVAACNIGTETMSDGDQARLRRIAQTPWVRHFDDRLGLSPIERERLAGEPWVPLPAVERLLADRPRDLVPRTSGDVPDPAFGFRMEMPEHLYNRGELYNLSVRRGTLTAEERYKINEHMVHTVMMLERMPFPKHLRRVPEYAGTHHERMDGKGYPRRLGAWELSVPSRIMAVADIFEALTASDRPYKSPKKLSEALRVLQAMAGDHLDPHLVNLFITSGVFLDIANKHLMPEQIDVVDGTPYLARVAHVG